MKINRHIYSAILVLLILLAETGLVLAEPYSQLRVDYQELSRSVQLQRQRVNWEKLLKRFDAYVRKNPLSSTLDKALFLQARTWDGLSKASGRKEDASEALDRYVAMSERFPNSRLSDDALFHAGQAAEYRIGDKHRARALYQLILKRFPAGDMARDARKKLAALPPGTTTRSQTKVQKKSKKETPGSYQRFADSPRLENVRFWSGPEYTRIVLDLSAPIVAKPHKLSGDNPRVYFDLLYTKLGNSLPSVVAIQNGLVRQVRSSLFDEQRTRVVIDLNRAVEYRLITLDNPHRLVIDVLGAPGKEVLATAGTAAQGSSGDDSIASILDSSADRLPSLHVPQTRNDEGIKLVVVDAGHGGRDPGAIGPSGVYEKNVTLPLAKALAKALRQKMGVKVLMTRTDDRYLELRERTDYANRVGADLFISLHANASPRGKAYGVETYFLNLSKNNQAAEVAARENGTSLQEVSNLEAILFDLMANAKINESSRLAAEVQQSMIAGLKPHFTRIKDLGVKQGPFHVLLGATMPSVLIEAAFISHPREEKRLTSSSYQKHVANAIVNGVKHYSSSLEQVVQR